MHICSWDSERRYFGLRSVSSATTNEFGQVEDFVPYYVFRGDNVNELRVGASMIKEALVRERKKLEDEKHKHEREEAERKAHEEKVRSCDTACVDISPAPEVLTRPPDTQELPGRPAVRRGACAARKA